MLETIVDYVWIPIAIVSALTIAWILGAFDRRRGKH